MARLTLERKWIWLIVATAVLLVLGAKAIQQGWLTARPPLELNDKPTILFFNNEQGCDCVLAIYQRADAQVAAWPAESRHGVSLHRIHLKQRPDLGKQYQVVRAPTLLLLDAGRNEVWRQDEVTSDWHIFDLETAEAQILSLQRNDNDE